MKGDKGKSMIRVLYVLQFHVLAMLSSEEIKPVAFSIVKLHLAEAIS